MSDEHQQQESTAIFVIQSKIDNKDFTVDRKVIDSSALLKNICDITEITEPISIDCPSDSLQVFINLINHYQTIDNAVHDTEFEKELYDSVTLTKKKKLIKLVQDLCILDSDFFLNSVSDYILRIIGNEKRMDYLEYIQQYLGLESDFTKRSKNLMENDEKLEYLFSINTQTFKFPFPNKNLYSLKTDFSTPMNVLISRIVERSDERISYLLSLINKTLKNEVDRHPLKVDILSCGMQGWKLALYYEQIKNGFTLYLDCSKFDESFFDMRKIHFNKNFINIIKKRKIIAKEVSMSYKVLEAGEPFIDSSSLDFVTSKSIEISFAKSYKLMYSFDVTQCSIPSILYRFTSEERGVKFDEIYQHLIAKDLSKNIRLDICDDICKYFYPIIGLELRKKLNAAKFESLNLNLCHTTIYSEFKNFITKYMDDDAWMFSSSQILGIPLEENFVYKKYYPYKYKVSHVKKYLNRMVTK